MSKREEIEQEIEETSEISHIYQRKPYSAVVVTYTTYDNYIVIGFGFSKVCHPDKWDAKIGIAIAHKRAIRDIRKQIMR